jgi:hypothetical protein
MDPQARDGRALVVHSACTDRRSDVESLDARESQATVARGRSSIPAILFFIRHLRVRSTIRPFSGLAPSVKRGPAPLQRRVGGACRFARWSLPSGYGRQRGTHPVNSQEPRRGPQDRGSVPPVLAPRQQDCHRWNRALPLRPRPRPQLDCAAPERCGPLVRREVPRECLDGRSSSALVRPTLAAFSCGRQRKARSAARCRRQLQRLVGRTRLHESTDRKARTTSSRAARSFTRRPSEYRRNAPGSPTFKTGPLVEIATSLDPPPRRMKCVPQATSSRERSNLSHGG